MIGIIGGSGLYRMEGIENPREEEISTPFGMPSAPYLLGSIEGRDAVFLARHGAGHRILPSEINYRANIYGLKKLGVERIIAVNAVGSLREDIKPLDAVLPEQFFDRTKRSEEMTFFGDGIAAHVSFSRPVCPELQEVLSEAGGLAGGTVHRGGVYLNMEGPAFSTRAESVLYREWGMDVIGMTALAEAKLSREAEICYAALAMVTDYDCWREGEPVEVEEILGNMRKNSLFAERMIKLSAGRIPGDRKCGCGKALSSAIVTAREYITDETRQKLGIIINRYL